MKAPLIDANRKHYPAGGEVQQKLITEFLNSQTSQCIDSSIVERSLQHMTSLSCSECHHLHTPLTSVMRRCRAVRTHGTRNSILCDVAVLQVPRSKARTCRRHRAVGNSWPEDQIICARRSRGTTVQCRGRSALWQSDEVDFSFDPAPCYSFVGWRMP